MEHNIKTLEDILKVVKPETLDNFLTDLRGWLTLHMAVEVARQLNGDMDIQSDNTTMHWIDDGKTDAKITIEVTNQ